VSNIEPKIKAQYARFFQSGDWQVFKQLAEQYLDTAVHLRKKHIQASGETKLWFRNAQKRLFIGVGCELLLKSHYLKNGYGINTPREGKWHLYRIQNVDTGNYDVGRTYTLGWLLDQLKNGPCLQQRSTIEQGFRIAKVFRNKEGHIAVYWHHFEAQNYTDTETALVAFYQEAFSQVLDIQISFERDEPAQFSIRK
jgi:hypothetical protein